MNTISEWIIRTPDPAAVADIRNGLGCLPLTAVILANRGPASAREAREFLDTGLAGLRPPFGIRDMTAAADRLIRAIHDRERILIFGDYDVDGVTATTILVEFLRETGAVVEYYIPHRTREGYDFQAHHVTGRALPAGVDLIVTVDCGSSRVDAVATALASGIDVIVTDHHTITEPPTGVPVVNPKRPDCGAGFEHLAGVGVAFCLVMTLRARLRDQGFWRGRIEPTLRRFCDLVALGTVADLVPLVRENRILAAAGLSVINAGTRPGVAALVRAAGLTPPLSAEDIAYRLGPRINACGRVSHAHAAVELLLTRDPAEAERMALSLNGFNRHRQETERRLFESILARLERSPRSLETPALVMHHPDWHQGVLGIVAAKLADRFLRPVILIATKGGTGKGSCRSVPGVNIHEALVDCRRWLVKFGGHPLAAGLEILPDHLDAFQEDFQAAIARRATGPVIRAVTADAEIRLSEASESLITELEGLEPFGEANPAPLFVARNVTVTESWVFGGRHRRMTLRQEGDDGALQAMRFNASPEELAAPRFDRIAFKLQWRHWEGKKSPQAVVSET